MLTFLCDCRGIPFGGGRVVQGPVPTSRLLILCALAHEPSSVSALTGATKLSQPLVSQHWRLLRGINLVTATRSGREIIYSLTDDHVARVIQDAIAHSHESQAPAPPAPAKEKEHDRGSQG
ncbi:helix-turn-helix transcriptional regulator [Arthrobacter sp. KBS0703]|uniref:ArsR/SmtB family transcription factor n=1 Tax=Arthrobacter sp. KBS0703 TaxID=1955698 RepID=UPI0009D2E6A9|nr:metalloregulator ArsR/SmtB family transcription factor [Arthrobacter sp. KBS0703]